jgi:hypothetical protein
MADSTMGRRQSLQLEVQSITGTGGKVDFVDIPQWESSDETVFKIEPSDDGLTAMIIPEGIGIADCTVTADGLNGIWNIEVTGARIVFQANAPTS